MAHINWNEWRLLLAVEDSGLLLLLPPRQMMTLMTVLLT